MNQSLPARNEVTWLVKSGDRILGPFSAESIEKLLLSREIVVIDEIKKSLGRWKYIREESYFTLAVEKLRTSHQSKIEDTEHGTLSNPTRTQTNSVTADISKTFDLELPEKELSKATSIKEAEFIDLPTPRIEPPPNVSAAAVTKQFGMNVTPQAQEDIKKSSTAVWLFAVFFIGIALTIAYKNQTKSGPGPGPDFAKSYDLAIRNYRQGRFSESLKFYKEAASIKPNDPDVIIGMAPLLLGIEGQKVEVKRKIGEVLAMVHSEDQVKQAKNILGLVAIADEDFVEASHQFNDALKIDAKFVPALYNTGIVHFLLKDYTSALKFFSNVMAEDPENAMAAYLMIRIKVIVAVLTKKSSNQEIHESISSFVKKFYDLRQEAIFLNVYLYSREEVKPELIEQTRLFLESDPFVSDEYFRDPLMSASQLGWSHLSGYCDEITKKYVNLSDMKALNAICLLKTGRLQESPKLIEEALAQAPGDSILLDIKSYILMTSGRSEEAQGALRIAKKNQNDILSKILSGRICMKNREYKCARENFQYLAKQEFTPVVATIGLAEISHREGSNISLKMYRDQLKRNLQNYLPSLRLESELEDK